MYGELEGTRFEALDPSFDECIIGHARVERLWTGARWAVLHRSTATQSALYPRRNSGG